MAHDARQRPEETRNAFVDDVNGLWNAVFGPAKQQQPSYAGSQSPRSKGLEQRVRDLEMEQRRLQYRQPEGTPPYENRAYVRPGVSSVSPSSSSARRIVVDNGGLYDSYQAAYAGPVSREHRKVEPHEMRILGEREVTGTAISYYGAQNMHHVAVPTSRETHR